MIAIIYRAWVLPGQEEIYTSNWQLIADYFVAARGAIGSALHKSEAGYFVIYSRWPDQQTWQNSWPQAGTQTNTELPETIHIAINEIQACVDQSRKFDDIITTVVADKIAQQ